MKQSAIGAAALALGVVMGAFGAHSLRDRLTPALMSVYEKAVLYHLVHAVGLLIIPVFGRIGALAANVASRIWWILLAGIVLFSGSLYVLAVSGTPWLGAVTPLGGVAFIVAWLMLAWELSRR